MLSKVQKPKTKQELVKAIQACPFSKFQVYENSEIKNIPSKEHMSRMNYTIIVLM
jgi:hypothetical protein